MNMREKCPNCFSFIEYQTEKMLTCPYCDSILYLSHGRLQLGSEYPWWSKHEPLFGHALGSYKIVGIIRTEQWIEIYSFKNNEWFVNFKDLWYRLTDEKLTVLEKLGESAAVAKIYGKLPVFTPINFKTSNFIENKKLYKKEVEKSSVFELVE